MVHQVRKADAIMGSSESVITIDDGMIERRLFAALPQNVYQGQSKGNRMYSINCARILHAGSHIMSFA